VIIVADASPLIFLGKIGQLELIPSLFKGEILIPSSVRVEILAQPVSPAEERRLKGFLARCRIITVAHPEYFSAGMSRSDNEALTLAVRRHADLLLADERLMRDMAVVEGIRPLGTLGILLLAMRKRLLNRKETHQLVEMLVRDHQFRISVALYDSVLSKIAAAR